MSSARCITLSVLPTGESLAVEVIGPALKATKSDERLGATHMMVSLSRLDSRLGTAWWQMAAVAGVLLLSGCSGQSSGTNSVSVQNQTPSGTVTMHQVQAAFIGSGNTGDGTLRFQGTTHQFKVSGLGVGGIGVSTIDATGEVYDLKRVSDFEGAYAQGRYGFAVGEESGGDLWLQNDKGVVMHLKAKRTGLMLSLGGDAVVVTLEN